MKLNARFQKMLTEEIDFVLQKMDVSAEPLEKLYYFSAIFGMIHRIFNQEFHPDLVHAHLIIRATYDSFFQRIKAIEAGDKSVLIYEEQFKKLHELIAELGEQIKKKQSIDSTLKKFVMLLYTTTGNGFYLLQKGVLKI